MFRFALTQAATFPPPLVLSTTTLRPSPEDVNTSTATTRGLTVPSAVAQEVILGAARYSREKLGRRSPESPTQVTSARRSSSPMAATPSNRLPAALIDLLGP